VIFEPLDFIAKLAALVPKPKVNLTRFHGVFAHNSKHRVDVTPAKRGKGRTRKENQDKPPEQRHRAMTWAQCLKRVFNIDVSVSPTCGGDYRVIACVENQAAIDLPVTYVENIRKYIDLLQWHSQQGQEKALQVAPHSSPKVLNNKEF